VGPVGVRGVAVHAVGGVAVHTVGVDAIRVRAVGVGPVGVRAVGVRGVAVDVVGGVAVDTVGVDRVVVGCRARTARGHALDIVVGQVVLVAHRALLVVRVHRSAAYDGTGRPAYPTSARRNLHPRPASSRCCCGLTPRTRLNAALNENGLVYPTRCATALRVTSGSRSMSAATVTRHPVRYAIGGSPTSSRKRRASAVRETPTSAASDATVQ